MIDMLERELIGLPNDKLSDVVKYIQFLKFNLTSESKVPTRKHSERQLGILKGKFVMADDFDDTPDCFKGYM